jgi:beta-alanine degradation protein BauB
MPRPLIDKARRLSETARETAAEVGRAAERRDGSNLIVIPAKAGIQSNLWHRWIPAFAGMTRIARSVLFGGLLQAPRGKILLIRKGRKPVAFDSTIHARSTLQVDDDRVRVTRWDFAPGATTGWHEHELPYCIVMVIGGTLALHDGERVSQVELAAGDSYVRPKGVRHDVMNASEHPIAFVEVEMKW